MVYGFLGSETIVTRESLVPDLNDTVQWLWQKTYLNYHFLKLLVLKKNLVALKGHGNNEGSRGLQSVSLMV